MTGEQWSRGEPASTNPKAARILDAATGVFTSEGYGAASMDRIASEAGVSKATVYAHFHSKERLFATIVRQECQRQATTIISSEMRNGAPLPEALNHIGLAFLEFLVSPPALRTFRVVAAESSRFPALGRAFYQSGPEVTIRALADFLTRARDRGDIELADPQAAAEQLLAMIRGHIHLRCLLGVEASPPREKLQRQVAAAVAMFCRAYSVT